MPTASPHANRSTLFVVRPASASAPSPMPRLSRLKDEERLLDVAPLKGGRRGWLVRVAGSAKSQRQAWNALRKELGEKFSVIPALGDADGGYSYPTGYLSLLFEDGATRERLQDVARHHNLKLVRREQFTQKQALFKPENAAEAFLPSLIDKIAKDKTVDDVWLDAESVYQRG